MNTNPTEIQELKARVAMGEVNSTRAKAALRWAGVLFQFDKLVLQNDKLRASKPLSPAAKADFKKRSHVLREGVKIKGEIRRLLRTETLQPRVEAIEGQVTEAFAPLA